MSFQWPVMFATLVVVPMLVAGYVLVVRRRARARTELGAVGLLPSGTASALGWKRHLPAALFLAAIAVMLVALARPQVDVSLPRRDGQVILAFDASASMRADDLKPTRLDAAKAAAKAFVARQPSSIRVGVVAFGNAGFVIQPPTSVKHDVLSAIRRIKADGGTSLGQAILTSLDALTDQRITVDAKALAQGAQQPNIPFIGSAVVILLTDGENTSQPDPVAIADIAAQAGVRIDSIGIGKASGAVVEIDGYSVATALDESLLRDVASATNGTYFRAADATQLAKIYQTIDLRLSLHREHTEITGLVAAAGIVLLLAGGFLSMRWFGRAV